MMMAVTTFMLGIWIGFVLGVVMENKRLKRKARAHGQQGEK